MIYALSHIEIAVSNLSDSQCFYIDQLGFDLIESSPTQVLLQHGFMQVYLFESSQIMPAKLWFESTEPEQTAEALTSYGCRLYKRKYIDKDRLCTEVKDPDQHHFVFWRELKDEERPELPALPKTKPWEPAAEALLQRLLTNVPEDFRKGARLSATLEAEFVAQGVVTQGEAVIGYIRSAPPPFRDKLKAPLSAEGIRWQDYEDELKNI